LAVEKGNKRTWGLMAGVDQSAKERRCAEEAKEEEPTITGLGSQSREPRGVQRGKAGLREGKRTPAGPDEGGKKRRRGPPPAPLSPETNPPRLRSQTQGLGKKRYSRRNYAKKRRGDREKC